MNFIRKSSRTSIINPNSLSNIKNAFYDVEKVYLLFSNRMEYRGIITQLKGPCDTLPNNSKYPECFANRLLITIYGCLELDKHADFKVNHFLNSSCPAKRMSTNSG